MSSLLSQQLRLLRGSRSLLDIEKGTGITRVQIMRFEKAIRVPNPKNLRQLADFYQVAYEELRTLYFEDLYNDPAERAIVLSWAKKVSEGVHISVKQPAAAGAI